MGTILAIVFFVTTIIATVIIAIKFAKKKQPVWAYKTTKIIGLGTNPPPELRLTFRGNPVNDVYQTTFIFFNSGNEAIRKDDVTEKVTLHLEGAKILRAPVIKAMSKETINPSVRMVPEGNERCVELDFLYLDHRDGALVEIMHTKSQRITCKANIIGSKQVKNIGELSQSRPRFLRTIISLSLFFAIAFVTWMVIKYASGLSSDLQLYLNEHSVINALALTVFPGLGGFSIAVLIYAIPAYLSTRKFPNWSLIRK